MGAGADNVLDRMAASVGELTAVEPVFQAVSDVPNGGVLFALEASPFRGIPWDATDVAKLSVPSRLLQTS